MDFLPPLLQGSFSRRYKRFFADVVADERTLTAHLPNTGSLMGCLREGAPCLYSASDDPKRKLRYTLQMVRDGNTWVGVNTQLANHIVFEAWQQGRIGPWLNYDGGQREVKLNGQSRIDLVLWKTAEQIPATSKISSADFERYRFRFVEIKSVTMASGGLAQFPDAVTVRGQKHLDELIRLKDQGHEAEILFVVQRQDCRAFAPADHIDPDYGKKLRTAIRSGVKISVYGCELSPQGVRLNPTPLALEI